MSEAGPQATFRSMDEATPSDWQAIGSHFMPYAGALADRVLTHLRLLDGDYGGFPVDRLQHSLQTATRAHRAGEADDYVVMALLHDIGDTLGSYNHPDIAAAILKPFISPKLHWICQNHGIFQGYYFFHYLGLDRNLREQYRGHEHFEDTARFCELYDQAAFDKDYDSEPLEYFEPMVRKLFERPINSIYMATAESG
ncbi:HD domain-containing protein [Sphingomonas sp. LY160]|uniref:HD domain-containing protein n=1 Tax=Sphingomonas sp. LY160 TaxID=3095342 RepID=UPI002ADEF78D|nr:HD domain-containing protein [Sphingomonas sp. LY160]MEA1072680.1 HD domain-containing protein [Sphingomonas sp. LY160]